MAITMDKLFGELMAAQQQIGRLQKQIAYEQDQLVEAKTAQARTTAPGTLSVSYAKIDEIVRIVIKNGHNRKIHSIKEIRNATSLGLKEAKDVVDALSSSLHPMLKALDDEDNASSGSGN